MKLIVSSVFCAFFLMIPISGQADATSEQLLKMIQEQQRQLDSLKRELARSQQISKKASTSTNQAAEVGPTLPDEFSFGGAMEIEATESESVAGVDSSDITLAKLEAFFDAKPAEHLSTHFQLLYEDDGAETISLDEAYAILGNTEDIPVYLQIGKWAMPFGGFDTAMSTDPLTKTLGETSEKAVLVGYTNGAFSLDGYLFNGDTQQANEDDEIDQFGVSATFETEINGSAMSVGAGYLSNITDSGTITDSVTGGTALTDYVPGREMHASLNNGPFTIYGGYMEAESAFQAGELAFNSVGARPLAWNLEGAFVTEAFGKETTLAITYQASDEALALSLPETRLGGAITFQVNPNYSATIEYLHDEDYSTSDGGTGSDGHTATLKLAAEF